MQCAIYHFGDCHIFCLLRLYIYRAHFACARNSRAFALIENHIFRLQKIKCRTNGKMSSPATPTRKVSGSDDYVDDDDRIPSSTLQTAITARPPYIFSGYERSVFVAPVSGTIDDDDEHDDDGGGDGRSIATKIILERFVHNRTARSTDTLDPIGQPHITCTPAHLRTKKKENALALHPLLTKLSNYYYYY